MKEHCATSSRMPLFGQILAALYQADIVEEDDIRKWHSLSESKGAGRKPGVETENVNKCWVIGSHMIKQFDAQSEEEDSDSEAEEQEKDVDEKSKEPTPVVAEEEETTETGSEMETETESEMEEDMHPRRRNTIVATGPPPGVKFAGAPVGALPQQGTESNVHPPASVEDSESEAELTDSTEAQEAGVSASDDSGTNPNTEDEESEDD